MSTAKISVLKDRDRIHVTFFFLSRIWSEMVRMEFVTLSTENPNLSGCRLRVLLKGQKGYTGPGVLGSSRRTMS